MGFYFFLFCFVSARIEENNNDKTMNEFHVHAMYRCVCVCLMENPEKKFNEILFNILL